MDLKGNGRGPYEKEVEGDLTHRRGESHMTTEKEMGVM